MNLSDIEKAMGRAPLLDADLQRLRNHVEQLCEANGARWIEDERVGLLGSEADPDQGWIRTPPLRSEFDYWAAVHEIAHVDTKLPTYDRKGNVLFDNELAIWKWAIDKAIIHPSGNAGAGIRSVFDSHEPQHPSIEQLARLRDIVGTGGSESMRFK